MKIYAPGKIILSGEHSAVYGKPAIAMAVNRYVVSTVTPHFLPFVSFDLSDLSYQDRLSLSALQFLKNRIKKKYQRFLQGEFKIKEVLQKPMELAQFAMMLFFEMFNIKLTQGIKIHVKSDIPIGCGMGSSAATILSILHAIAHHLEVKLSDDLLYRLGLEAENMQHGVSSGLDVRVSLQGGCLFIKDGKIISRPVPQIPIYLVNTGTPESSTGECVTHVAPIFKTSSIGNDFAAVTEALDQALLSNEQNKIHSAIDENHHLLTKIGVVPERVQQFIVDVKEQNGVAKICGAGAVYGSKAGVVLVKTEDKSALQTLCHRYDYSLMPVSIEPKGVHLV